MSAVIPLRTGYVICGEPRSGSNYLCQLLTSAGTLGRPLDYFNGPGMRDKGRPNYPQDPEGQFEQLRQLGTTANGIYGFKMFSDTFDRISTVRWAERLPVCRYILLTRRDLLAQAISQVRAEQTGRYRSTTIAVGEPRYDGERLASLLRHTAAGYARWEMFFARNALTPLRVAYEDVVAAPENVGLAAARLLGLPDDDGRVDPAVVEVQVQRDHMSEQWRRRFVADFGGLERLDPVAATEGPAIHRPARWWQRRR